MAPRAGGARRNTPLTLVGGAEWVGGRVTLPVYVTEGTPHRPEADIWLELPSALVVAFTILDPTAPASFADTLREAMGTPRAGPARRPARVRVRDASLAREARAALGDGTEVVVAPTPELDEIIRHIAESMPEGDEPASYLEGGRVPPDAVEDLFKAAGLLYRAAPWKRANDGQLLRLDIPQLGIAGACVSIVGALGESLGFLIFPSLAAFDTYVAVATEQMERGGVPDETLDLGSSVLSLTFERGSDLPAAMRREVKARGLRVEGPAAYPRVERRDRDAMTRPLTEADVRTATACAGALAAFADRHGEIFTAPSFAPVSESYGGERGPTVRLAAPYGTWPLFKDDLLEAEPALDSVAPVGRNEPCPCGSGKKYKKCHLRAESPPGRAPIHDLDGELAAKMVRYAERRFGEDWLAALEDFDDPQESATLSAPWSLYHFTVRGRPVVEWFLEERRAYLAPNERSWLEAQGRAWMSVWEVQSVEPGRSLTLEDLLTGERRTVKEASASALLAARDAFLGRITDHDGLSLLTGSHPRPLPPSAAAEVVRQVRTRLRLRRAVPIGRLRAAPIGRYLIDRWEEAVDELDERRSIPPQLRNTDGDEFLLTTDRFEFDPALRSEVESRIAAIEGIDPPEEGEEKPSYAFLREGNEMHPEWENTVLGTAWVSDGSLKLETNSARRADTLRARLEGALGDLVRHRARDHTDPRAFYRDAIARGEPEPLDVPEPEVQEILREQKERHYDRWMDSPLPALDGQSAREAVRSARGRERVDVLLKELENRDAREPAHARFDFGPIRKELGL